VLACGIQINILLVIDPALDLAWTDADADVIPAVVGKICLCRGFIVGGIIVVNARNAAGGTGPAAYYKGYEGPADRKGQAAEEVVSIQPHGVEIDFVVHTGHRTGPGDAGQIVAELQDNGFVFDVDVSVVGEVSNLPLPQIPAVEQTDLARRHVFGNLRLLVLRLLSCDIVC